MVRRRRGDAGGIAALVDTLATHWRAVQRDLLTLGYRESDIGTRLDLGEMIAVVCAAPAGTAVRWALEQGWSREAHLLANLTEREAGLINLPSRYPRPGIDVQPAPAKPGAMQPMTITELEKRRQAKRNKGVKPVV